jgi:hypothetical protein
MAVTRIVRTATPEVDRRQTPRYSVDRPCRMTVGGSGSVSARLIDVSEGGASLRAETPVAPGSTGTLQVDGVGFALPFVVHAAEKEVSEFLCVRLVQSHPPLGERL